MNQEIYRKTLFECFLNIIYMYINNLNNKKRRRRTIIIFSFKRVYPMENIELMANFKRRILYIKRVTHRATWCRMMRLGGWTDKTRGKKNSCFGVLYLAQNVYNACLLHFPLKRIIIIIIIKEGGGVKKTGTLL